MGPKDLGSKPDWDELLEIGIREREQGSVKKGIKLLREALTLCPYHEKRMDIRNHLGLAYFHGGDYENAVSEWNEVITISNVQSDPDLKARASALRNLSRKELCNSENDFEEAYNKANQARELAIKLGRNDLPWFTHGLISIYYDYSKKYGRVDKEFLKFLVDCEKIELPKAWKKASKLERGAWFTGLLWDYALLYNKVSRPILISAISISRILKMKRREEQLSKRLDEMTY